MVIENRTAKFNYFIEDVYQAGLELVGSEVKSIRAGKANIKDSFVKIIDNQAYLINANITTYDKTSTFAVDQLRNRKLLLHKSQIAKLKKSVEVSGYSLIPLKMYFIRGYVKLDVGVCKGKKLYDKRESIKAKDIQRLAERELSRR